MSQSESIFNHLHAPDETKAVLSNNAESVRLLCSSSFALEHFMLELHSISFC